jgi:phosphoglycerol transferase
LWSANGLIWTPRLMLEIYSSNPTRAENKFGRLDAIATVMLAVFVLWGAWELIGGSAIDWKAPLMYEGDSILHLLLIKRLWDGHGYLLNTVAGFPFGSSFHDFPGSDGFSLATLWLLAKITKSVAISFNAYYLLGFPAAAISAFVVFRSQGIARMPAIAASVLFAFAPFHFLRLGHLYYTWYFVIPIFFWYGIRVSESLTPVFKKNSLSSSRWRHAFSLVLLSSFGVYYAFFGCIIIGLSGFFGAIRHHSLQPFKHAIIAGLIIALGVLANIAPNIAYFSEHGKNDVIAVRSPSEAEVHGLKLIQMLLPQQLHRSAKLREISERYNNNFPLVAENSLASLGVIASIGFLLMLGIAVLPRRSQTAASSIFLLAFLTVSLVLIATIGGFSAIFAEFVSAQIRAWNRISIFISFLGIFGFAYALHHIRPRAPIYCAALIISLVAFGIWDQSPAQNVKHINRTQENYRSDAAYIKKIEAVAGPTAAVYELPYMQFPESPGVGTLNAYDLGKPYLHSKNMRWSFGTMAGRMGDNFYQKLSQQPLPIQLEIVRYLGFTGLYIDRRGYADGGAAIEGELHALTANSSPLTNAQGNVAFYQLAITNVAAQMPLSLAAHSLLDSFSLSIKDGSAIFGEISPWQIDFSRSALMQLSAVTGLQKYEPWGTWSDGATIALRFKKALPKKFALTLTAKAFGPNIGQSFTVSIEDTQRIFVPQAEFETITLDVELKNSTDLLLISVPHPVSPKSLGANEDVRILGLGLKELKITPR